MSEAGTDQDHDQKQEWPTHCATCGTRLRSAVVDFDKGNADRPELRPGEMAAVDFCPNEECPDNKPGSDS